MEALDIDKCSQAAAIIRMEKRISYTVDVIRQFALENRARHPREAGAGTLNQIALRFLERAAALAVSICIVVVVLLLCTAITLAYSRARMQDTERRNAPAIRVYARCICSYK